MRADAADTDAATFLDDDKADIIPEGLQLWAVIFLKKLSKRGRNTHVK